AEAFHECADSVLRAPPGFDLPLQLDVHTLGHREPVWFPRHDARDLEAPRPDREHAAGARVGRMGVAAEHRLPGHVEPLHVRPVADSVAWSREEGAVPLADAPEEPVVVRILISRLEDMVFHLLRGLPNRDEILST